MPYALARKRVDVFEPACRFSIAKYALLFIDADGNIGMSKEIEFSNDEQASNMAGQEAGDHRAIQIWDRDRPVCLVGNSAPR